MQRLLSTLLRDAPDLNPSINRAGVLVFALTPLEAADWETAIQRLERAKDILADALASGCDVAADADWQLAKLGPNPNGFAMRRDQLTLPASFLAVLARLRVDFCATVYRLYPDKNDPDDNT